MSTVTAHFLTTKQPRDEAVKQEPAKHWFTRHLLRPTQRKDQERGEIVRMFRQMSLRRPGTASSTRRPSTAPASGQATKDESIPPLPSIPPQFQNLAARQKLKATPRPPRPDPNVVLDVDAWLDASKPSSSLMGGLSYWREGNPAGTDDAANVQYVIPIIQEPDCDRSSVSHSQQLKSFCRRAKKQVRMPSISRVKSRQAVEKDGNERFESAPTFAIPYDQTEVGEAPVFFTRMSTSHTATRPSTAAASTPAVPVNNRCFVPNADLPLCRNSPSSIQLRDVECDLERLVLGQGPLTGGTLRPGALAAAHLPREDSMGSLGSSAPTYFSGMPPPSYKSRPASLRPASILTTSSFGCIDGMNPEYRKLSQKRAAQKQRSMKGRLRKLAKKANIGK